MEAPSAAHYEPNAKTVERRTTAAPQLAKMNEERFKCDPDKLNAPAPGQYEPSKKFVDRRTTAAPQLAK